MEVCYVGGHGTLPPPLPPGPPPPTTTGPRLSRRLLGLGHPPPPRGCASPGGQGLGGSPPPPPHSNGNARRLAAGIAVTGYVFHKIVDQVESYLSDFPEGYEEGHSGGDILSQTAANMTLHAILQNLRTLRSFGREHHLIQAWVDAKIKAESAESEHNDPGLFSVLITCMTNVSAGSPPPPLTPCPSPPPPHPLPLTPCPSPPAPHPLPLTPSPSPPPPHPLPLTPSPSPPPPHPLPLFSAGNP